MSPLMTPFLVSWAFLTSTLQLEGEYENKWFNGNVIISLSLLPLYKHILHFLLKCKICLYKVLSFNTDNQDDEDQWF